MNKSTYRPSFVVLIGVTVLLYLLTRSDLPLPAHVITFNLILLLLVADTLRWEIQEGIEHEKVSEE